LPPTVLITASTPGFSQAGDGAAILPISFPEADFEAISLFSVPSAEEVDTCFKFFSEDPSGDSELEPLGQGEYPYSELPRQDDLLKLPHSTVWLSVSAPSGDATAVRGWRLVVVPVKRDKDPVQALAKLPGAKIIERWLAALGVRYVT
jgi:hypothetical protein